MPAPIITEDQSGLQQGLSQGFNALSQALGMRMQKNREAGGLGIFQTGLESAKDDPNSISKAYLQAISEGADPDQINMLQQQYTQARKQNAFKTASDKSKKFGGINTPEGKESFISTYAQEGGDVFKLIESFKTKNKDLSPFEKKKQEKTANIIFEGIESSSSANQQLSGLNNLRKIADELQGMGGLWNSATGGEKSATFDAMGLAAIEPAIEIFNPRGSVPQQKIEMVKQKFAPKAWEFRETQEGKIKALEFIAHESIKKGEKLASLYEKYGEDIPLQELLRYEADSIDFMDNLLTKDIGSISQEKPSEPSEPSKSKYVEKLPTSGVKINTTAKDENTGQMYIWNGSRWMKQK